MKYNSVSILYTNSRLSYWDREEWTEGSAWQEYMPDDAVYKMIYKIIPIESEEQKELLFDALMSGLFPINHTCKASYIITDQDDQIIYKKEQKRVTQLRLIGDQK